MRHAKIVATWGPAVSSYDHTLELIRAGVNVARLNMSHGTYNVHEGIYRNIRRAEIEVGRPIAVLADLQGPKIRLGKFEGGPYQLEVGDEFAITTREVVGTRELAGTTHKGLPGDVKPGDPLLVDDGKVALRAVRVTEDTVYTTVEVPGAVSNNKGINLPGVAVNVPALSEKDEEDLRWALALGADYIALSFVRNAADITRVHEIMDEEGTRLPVIAKIEKPQAVENLEEIVAAFDGIMVARGDLGVEMPLERVPVVQAEAVALARRNAKPVIVATQVLESMIENPRPTRAEASDCANAVLDGADAVMLSGETSVGAYPVEAVATMARIIEATEEHALDRIEPLGAEPRSQGGALTLAASEVADFIGARYICVFTESGDTVRRMSRLRRPIPILGFTPDANTRRRMELTWGARSYEVPRVDSTDEMFAQADQLLLEKSRAQIGEKVVIIAGSPPGIVGTTNTLRIHRMGETTGQLPEAGPRKHTLQGEGA
ncbi:pyruvate kinase [Leucobacter chromiireducens]|uniref:Pyruvate kinase n=1 Tax=Leucobacter chromiireducens subsp. solipictus TaxID=398235 RepID=A0ABS1SB51_9MICO|nr:pyruvate kinase [Leucobacter chromiireducens]MBL3677773.1 pyruvate kinase [Leucobacter chromiireducens subsp. solipictus]